MRLASGQDDATTARALDELCRAGILTEGEDGYDFGHDLVRDTAYELQPSARRTLVHLRVGEALEELHATHLQDVSAMLGEQYSRARLPDRAVRHLRSAAADALRVFATERCIELLRAAVAQIRNLPPDRPGTPRSWSACTTSRRCSTPATAGRLLPCGPPWSAPSRSPSGCTTTLR